MNLTLWYIVVHVHNPRIEKGDVGRPDTQMMPQREGRGRRSREIRFLTQVHIGRKLRI